MTKGSRYPKEFHERAVRLARGTDRPLVDVARDLGIHPKTLRLWIRQDEADRRSGTAHLATGEREELKDLRREVKDLRRANEILKAASVFFARELDQPRPK